MEPGEEARGPETTVREPYRCFLPDLAELGPARRSGPGFLYEFLPEEWRILTRRTGKPNPLELVFISPRWETGTNRQNWRESTAPAFDPYPWGSKPLETLGEPGQPPKQKPYSLRVKWDFYKIRHLTGARSSTG